jgi:Kdo2-lipid IVA lauroyltransferase/acyltransferase
MYYIVFGILYAFSLLPMWILYGFSSLASFILYRVFNYRKEVVMSNLAHSFPEKTLEERKKIATKFYRNFTDNWIETIKLLSISQRSMNKKITGNYKVFNELFKTGKAVQLNLGHFFNWEIMTLHCGISQPYPFLTVYLPQTSKVSDRLLKYIRARWGNPLISSYEMAREIIPWRKKQYIIALGADQSPAISENAYWLYFLNRPTGFAKGPEKFARGQNIPVVMMTTTRPKRGHYHFDYFLLSDNPKSLPDGELMRRYVRHVEENIRLQPALYLWSHKRWKRPWDIAYEKLWVDDVPMPSA